MIEKNAEGQMDEILASPGRFYIVDGQGDTLAEIVYTISGADKLVIEHTNVDQSLKGRGVGTRLVRQVVDLARRDQRTIISHCPFAMKVLTGSREYMDVL
jgi:uncharacterized protein